MFKACDQLQKKFKQELKELWRELRVYLFQKKRLRPFQPLHQLRQFQWLL